MNNYKITYLKDIITSSWSYPSFFGANVLMPVNPVKEYNSKSKYLLLNTEFEYDTELIGFQVNAIRDGSINLTVILFILF